MRLSLISFALKAIMAELDRIQREKAEA